MLVISKLISRSKYSTLSSIFICQLSLVMSSWLSHRCSKQYFLNEALSTLPSLTNLFIFQTFPSQQLFVLLFRSAVCLGSLIFIIIPFPGTRSISSLTFLKILWLFSACSLTSDSPKYYYPSSGLCSNCFAGLNIYPLKPELHRVTSVTFCKHKHGHAMPLLTTLQWLPIVLPLKYKILIMAYKFLHNLGFLLTS